MPGAAVQGHFNIDFLSILLASFVDKILCLAMHVGVPTLYIGAYAPVDCEPLMYSYRSARVLVEIYPITAAIISFCE